MTANKKFQGIIVPILTPLNGDESVDTRSLRRLVDYLLDAGVYGIWASGTTGEFPALPDADRVLTIETVVDQVAGRVPVIANISNPSTRLTVDLARAVEESGVDGIAATPPYYYANAQDEITDHFRHIHDRVPLPLWVYHIPQNVKTAVAPGTVAALAAEGAVVGIKDSSGAGSRSPSSASSASRRAPRCCASSGPPCASPPPGRSGCTGPSPASPTSYPP